MADGRRNSPKPALTTSPALGVGGIVLSLTLLSGCSSFGAGKDKTLALVDDPVVLEIPPNLSIPRDSGLLVIPEPDNITQSSDAIEKHVLQPLRHVKLHRDGNSYWIEISGDRDDIWNNLIRFWVETEIKLRVNNRAHGIIETAWFSGDDNRFVSATKNKFRLRIEQSDREPQNLEIFITHYGTIAPDSPKLNQKWVNRDRDRDLEVEFLHQLADYLDRSQAGVAVTQTERGRYNISGESLTVAEDFRHTWRKVGIALEQAKILISDHDRSKGIYFVTEVDFLQDLNSKRGPLDRFLFGDKVVEGDPFEIHIRSREGQSIISIAGKSITPAEKIFVLKKIRDNL